MSESDSDSSTASEQYERYLAVCRLDEIQRVFNFFICPLWVQVLPSIRDLCPLTFAILVIISDVWLQQPEGEQEGR